MPPFNPDIPAAGAGARYVPGIPFPLSRHTDAVSVRPGARVIARYLIDDGEHATDIIGELHSITPLVIATPNREPVTISPDQVVVLKTLSASPVRNSDIRAVESAQAAAFPGLESRMISGWLARAGDGITERSNSAVPIGPSAGLQPVPLKEIREFYAAHSLPTLLLVPDRIGRTAERIAGPRGPEIVVMTRELSDISDVASELATVAQEDIVIADEPDDHWLSMYHFRGQALPERSLHLLAARIDGQMCFASLRVDGHVAAISRGTITTGGTRKWLGFSAVEVAPEFRRRGLASALGVVLLKWGREHGAQAAYLDVLASNIAGRALYHRLGFSEHHRHRSVQALG